jgi:hypothetical protein
MRIAPGTQPEGSLALRRRAPAGALFPTFAVQQYIVYIDFGQNDLESIVC